MTVEAWVYTASVGNWKSVVLKEGTSGLSYGLYPSNASSRPAGFIRRTSDIDSTGTSATPTNTWVHLAATYNGSTLTLFVNGSQVATSAITGSIVDVVTGAPHRRKCTVGASHLFAGRIDEVRIYSRALSAAEVQADMVTPVSQAGPLPPAPDFAVAVGPATQSIVRNFCSSYTVTITSTNGFSGPVALSASGYPAGTTATFNPPSVNGSGDRDTYAGYFGCVLLLERQQSQSGAPAARDAHGCDQPRRDCGSKLRFHDDCPAEYEIADARTNDELQDVTVTPQNGFSGPCVSFGVTGLPQGASAQFSPGTISSSGTTTMTVTTAADTPTGSSNVTIQAASGTLQEVLPFHWW